MTAKWGCPIAFAIADAAAPNAARVVLPLKLQVAFGEHDIFCLTLTKDAPICALLLTDSLR